MGIYAHHVRKTAWPVMGQLAHNADKDIMPATINAFSVRILDASHAPPIFAKVAKLAIPSCWMNALSV